MKIEKKMIFFAKLGGFENMTSLYSFSVLLETLKAAINFLQFCGINFEFISHHLLR